MQISDRTLFEIYREADYGRRYRVVYFTELNEHDRETEIARAMAGEHILDGFIADRHKEAAKQRIASFVEALNRGQSADVASLLQELEPYVA